MFAQRIVEVFTFVVINVLTMGYASLQGRVGYNTTCLFYPSYSSISFLSVYQFRGFGEFCDAITLVGWLALVNVS